MATVTEGANEWNVYALAGDAVGDVIVVGGNHRCARWQIVAIVNGKRYCKALS